LRGRIGVRDVLGENPHAAGLGAQAGGRDRDRFQKVHASPSCLVPRFRSS
jgi:hypothetical protein